MGQCVEHDACHDMAGVAQLLSPRRYADLSFYAVIAGDFHSENLIAGEESQPVPVDLETLFVPRARTLAGESERVAQRYLATVLQSLMLPSWNVGADKNTALDISGLGGSNEPQDAGVGLGWVHVDSDAMQVTRGSRTRCAPAHNQPLLPGRIHRSGRFRGPDPGGFDQGYRLLMRFREELLDPNGPLTAFGRCSSRIVLRATRIYVHLLRRSLMPRLLVSGVERSLEFEGLSRAMLAESGYEGARVFQAEAEAMERLDIPYFDAPTKSDVICADNGVMARGVLAAPSFDDVAERIRCVVQCGLGVPIRADSGQLRLAGFKVHAALLEPAGDTGFRRLAGAERLLREAEAIGARIAARAIWQDGAAYWIGADYNPGTDRFALQPVGTALYSGRGGMAVFLAALHASTGNPEYRRLALGAAHSIEQLAGQNAQPGRRVRFLARSHGIGGATGMSSVVYAMVTTAGLPLANPSSLMTRYEFHADHRERC